MGKSYQNFSILSLKETGEVESSNHSVGVYKGLTVSVYSVDKTELTLTRRDLIDLINVCCYFIYSSLSFVCVDIHASLSIIVFVCPSLYFAYSYVVPTWHTSNFFQNLI